MTNELVEGRNPQVRLFDDTAHLNGWSWTVTTNRGLHRVSLPDLVRASPDTPTTDWLFNEHVELLDAYLVTVAEQQGGLVGSRAAGRTAAQRRTGRRIWRTILRLVHEWVVAAEESGRVVTVRDANILGSAFVIAHLARRAADDLGARPLPDGLDRPGDGHDMMVTGRPDLVAVDPDRPELGTVWVLLPDNDNGQPLLASLRHLTNPFTDAGPDPDMLIGRHLTSLHQLLTGTTPDRRAAWGMALDLFNGLVDPTKGSVGFDAVRLPVEDPGGATTALLGAVLALEVGADPSLADVRPPR